MAEIHIKELLLLSPVGISTKEDDYKSYINSCSDIFAKAFYQIGWTFNLSFKTPFRLCSCARGYLINKELKTVNLK
jgi:hypothetical protein